MIVPAFGTTTELEAKLTELGVDVQKYNTTCPFVEKVETVGPARRQDYTVVIHGKPQHEETRATFPTPQRRGTPWLSKTAPRPSGWRSGWAGR